MSYSQEQYDFWQKFKKNGNSDTVKYVARLACDTYYEPKPGQALTKKYINSKARHDHYTKVMHDKAVAEQQRANIALAWSLGSAIVPNSTYHGGRLIKGTNIVVPEDW